ncbi:MAG TPA: POTRA domain-containing protein [Flavisolibacter sp.]|nr:POTRA domain-containing protein [Flavisolibacter sp.]
MAKINQVFAVVFFLTLLCSKGFSQSYTISYRIEDADTSQIHPHNYLQSSFPSRVDANAYVANILNRLTTEGFVTASVDSISLDSTTGTVHIYFGNKYKWAKLNTYPETDQILQQVRWPALADGNMDFASLKNWEQKILDHLEESGFPFGKVYLTDIGFNKDQVEATLHIEKGPIYKIDSIRLYGDAKVNKEFLQKYLEITNGSSYNRKTLQNISKKLAELNYLQEERPSDLTLLGSGSVLNLYLKTKKSSQVNGLVGFLPNNDPVLNRKLLLTVDANVLLRNSLGEGETIGLMWQQLQRRSPRLNILYEQPYVFNSPYGLNFTFDMYKLDSLFLNINMKLGMLYKLQANKTASLFLLKRQTIVNGINEAAIIQSKQLPQEADVSSFNLGITYDFYNTDYRFNPKKGSEFTITSSAGTKNIKKNALILELKDPTNPSYDFEKLYDTVKQKAYQYRLNATAAHYIPIGRQSTFKMGMNAGLYQSENYFRNDLFQIGGYKLLRGFNEESQFVSQYMVGTLEYRYLIGINSAFFVFADGGVGKHYIEKKKTHAYIGTGLGLSFETKAGIVNLAWAIGKRDDTELNLRQSKIHIGFASYF